MYKYIIFFYIYNIIHIFIILYIYRRYDHDGYRLILGTFYFSTREP